MNPKRDLVDRVFHASRGFGHDPGLGLTFPLLWGAQWKAYKYTPPHQLVEIEIVAPKNQLRNFNFHLKNYLLLENSKINCQVG
jgi:hypothetical protein